MVVGAGAGEEAVVEGSLEALEALRAMVSSPLTCARKRRRCWAQAPSPWIGTDADVFEAFYREHVDAVQRFVVRRVGDRERTAI